MSEDYKTLVKWLYTTTISLGLALLLMVMTGCVQSGSPNLDLMNSSLNSLNQIQQQQTLQNIQFELMDMNYNMNSYQYRPFGY